jgi:hypothetical protein
MNENNTLENRLAKLWLRSVHCNAALHDLAWRKQPTKSLRDAIATVSEVPGVAEELAARVESERARLTSKGYDLPA